MILETILQSGKKCQELIYRYRITYDGEHRYLDLPTFFWHNSQTNIIECTSKLVIIRAFAWRIIKSFSHHSLLLLLPCLQFQYYSYKAMLTKTKVSRPIETTNHDRAEKGLQITIRFSFLLLSSLHSTLYSTLHSSFYLISNCVLTWIMHCATKPREQEWKSMIHEREILRWPTKETILKSSEIWIIASSFLLIRKYIFTCVTSQFIHCALITQSNLDQRHERSMLMGCRVFTGGQCKLILPFRSQKNKKSI